MIEVITDLTTENGSGKVSVFYFGESVTPLVAVGAATQFWGAVAPNLSTGFTAKVRGSGRILDEGTGELTGFYQEASSANLVGQVTQEPVADAVQALIRWRTGVVVAGREVRGRTFVPMVPGIRIVDGNLNAAMKAPLDQAGQTLCAVTLGFGVWRRPTASAPGQHVQAVSADTWTELAVLRRRRG